MYLPWKSVSFYYQKRPTVYISVMPSSDCTIACYTNSTGMSQQSSRSKFFCLSHLQQKACERNTRMCLFQCFRSMFKRNYLLAHYRLWYRKNYVKFNSLGYPGGQTTWSSSFLAFNSTNKLETWSLKVLISEQSL